MGNDKCVLFFLVVIDLSGLCGPLVFGWGNTYTAL